MRTCRSAFGDDLFPGMQLRGFIIVAEQEPNFLQDHLALLRGGVVESSLTPLCGDLQLDVAEEEAEEEQIFFLRWLWEDSERVDEMLGLLWGDRERLLKEVEGGKG